MSFRDWKAERRDNSCGNGAGYEPLPDGETNFSAGSGLMRGNNGSAEKRRSGKTMKGNPTLEVTLIQCAKPTVRNTKSYFYTQYQRLVVRRGRNRATVAVAHSMLIAIYHILKEYVSFRDLGAEYQLIQQGEEDQGIFQED